MDKATGDFVFKGDKTNREFNKYGLFKCENCGYVGFFNDFPLEPRIRKKDWIISLIFLPIGGMGIVNLIGTYLQRSVKVRDRMCPICDKVIKLDDKQSKTKRR